MITPASVFDLQPEQHSAFIFSLPFSDTVFNAAMQPLPQKADGNDRLVSVGFSSQ